MKTYLLSIIAMALLIIIACEQPATNQPIEPGEETELPDYAAFDKKVEIMRSFFKAHSDEDLEALKEALSDTLKWNPPYYNDDEWLGKVDFVGALQNYHNDYEDINFVEGIVLADTLVNGMWSGSVFPKENASSSPDVLRIYGTWTATHTKTGKEIVVKWFELSWINEDGKISQLNEYFDVHGLAAQIADE